MFRLMARLLGCDAGTGSARGGSVRRFAPRLEVLDGRAMPSAVTAAGVEIGVEYPEPASRAMELHAPPGQVAVSGGALGGVTYRDGAAGEVAVSGGLAGGVINQGGARGGVVGVAGEEMPAALSIRNDGAAGEVVVSGGALGGVTRSGGARGGVDF